jgi:hypothetical protein
MSGDATLQAGSRCHGARGEDPARVGIADPNWNTACDDGGCRSPEPDLDVRRLAGATKTIRRIARPDAASRRRFEDAALGDAALGDAALEDGYAELELEVCRVARAAAEVCRVASEDATLDDAALDDAALGDAALEDGCRCAELGSEAGSLASTPTDLR